MLKIQGTAHLSLKEGHLSGSRSLSLLFFLHDHALLTPTLAPAPSTMLSPASKASVLSNKTLYPNFFRTAPPDNFQAKALASLWARYGWDHVAILATDDAYDPRHIAPPLGPDSGCRLNWCGGGGSQPAAFVNS